MDGIKERLSRIIHNGLDVDIFLAERSYAMFKEIGLYADRIKEQAMIYGKFFYVTQESFRNQYVLAVARLYDKPNDKFETRCVHGLLNFMQDNASQFPEILEKRNTQIAMQSSGFSQLEISLVSNGTAEQVALMLVEHYRAILGAPGNLVILEKLKAFRDKILAHNEYIPEQISTPTYAEINELIRNAKGLVGIVGWASLSMIYVLDGKYHLTDEAVSPIYSFRLLMKEALNLENH